MTTTIDISKLQPGRHYYGELPSFISIEDLKPILAQGICHVLLESYELFGIDSFTMYGYGFHDFKNILFRWTHEEDLLYTLLDYQTDLDPDDNIDIIYYFIDIIDLSGEMLFEYYCGNIPEGASPEELKPILTTGLVNRVITENYLYSDEKLMEILAYWNARFCLVPIIDPIIKENYFNEIILMVNERTLSPVLK
jgi:hypothetical protein